MTPGTAIVRRPSPRLAEGIVTHVQRAAVDAGRALEQWEGYVAALRDHGWRIVEVTPADEHPDGVFVEDAAAVLRGVAVATRPGAAQRLGEVDSVAETVAGLGPPTPSTSGSSRSSRAA
jgi:dimethylargininase